MAKNTTTKTTTALTTTAEFKAPTTQAEIPAALEQLRQMLSALKGGEDKAVSLEASFKGQKIANVKTVGELLEIEGAIQWCKKIYDDGVVKHNLSGQVKDFTMEGHSAEHWEKVIAKAINELLNSKKIQTIEAAIKKLSNHLDEQTKLQNTLKSIADDVMIPLS